MENTKDYNDLFINKNQVGADCQIIAALNASIYFYNKLLIKPNTKEYEDALKLTGCRFGSAIAVEKLFPVLKIKEKQLYKTFWDINFNDLPLEVKIWKLPYGFHSICAVNYIDACEAVRILNFDHETTTNGWMFTEKLYHFVTDCNSGWVARSFCRLE